MTHDGQRPDTSGFQIDNEMDLMYANAYPNPAREGCLPPDLIARLARREFPIDDPRYDHLAKCSPCFREMRVLQQAEAARAAAATKRRRMGLAAAAVLALTAAGAWVVMRQADGPERAAESRGAAVEQIARVDLRPFTVTRGGDAAPEPPPVVLARGRLRVQILLPPGAEPGDYDVQVLDGGLRSRADAKGTAAIQDFVTTVDATLDLSGVAPGPYTLAIRRQGRNWRTFPAEVR